MASNNISKYYKVDSGLDLTSDSQFATLSANEKIVYKPSGEKYIKNSNYSNVFDKTDTFGELESKINTKAVGRIENTNNSDGTTNYYSIDGTKLGSFKSGVSPNDLNDVRSTSITRIDDANTSTGICSCKNSSGTQIDTFTCHVPVSNNNSSLNWGQTSTIGTVDGTPLTVKMPANPDTKYSAGTGLGLEGTIFYIDENWLKAFIKDNGGGSYTVGERYGGTWYVSGSSTNGLKSSSDIYSELVIEQAGCSQGPSRSLGGNHPPSGTYYCEITGSNSCYIYTVTWLITP